MRSNNSLMKILTNKYNFYLFMIPTVVTVVVKNPDVIF